MNIIKSIRVRRKTFKAIAVFLAVNFLTQIFYPTVSFALTSGPAQEEFASFEPVGTTDMVDLYTGDFNYNIPLLSVPGPNGGYPINLAYHSGVGMDQEASWVGLGWNVNVGAINRQLRGLPDDFYGNTITHKMHLKTNTTIGFDIPKPSVTKREIFGLPPDPASDGFSPLSWQLYYNTYRGLGYRVFMDFSKDIKTNVSTVNVGLSFDSQGGFGIEPNLSVSKQFGPLSTNYKLGFSYNSQQGMQDLNFSTSAGIQASKQRILARLPLVGPLLTKEGGLLSIASSLSFAKSESFPSVTMPMKTTTNTFDVKYGNVSPFYGFFNSPPYQFWTGFYTVSKVDNNGQVDNPGYGFLYTAEGSDPSHTNYMRDYSTDNIPYSKHVPYLSPSQFTYDIYMQSGQGSGSTFRPYYNSVGILSQPTLKNTDESNRFNIEFGIGTAPIPPIHIGLGWTNMSGTNQSGRWVQVGSTADLGTELAGIQDFTVSSPAPANNNYETYYFQRYGEKNVTIIDPNVARNQDQLSHWGDDKAVRIKLGKDDDNNWLNRQFAARDVIQETPSPSAPAPYNLSAAAGKYRTDNSGKRQTRAANIETFTDEDAKKYGYSRYLDVALPGGIKSFSHGKQISEISMLQPDGMRYVYGLPAYNTYQTDALFSADYLITVPDQFVSIPNNGSDIDSHGDQEYINQTEITSPYAHSWLLTSVYSNDYIDLTNNGPTDDDYGYWVKFNYVKNPGTYQWRVPYKDANYVEGHTDYAADDKGSFTYGQKELYYLKSIETKTHIAVFSTSDREDAIAAEDKFVGGKPTSASINAEDIMKKLDQINLYSKKDWIANQSNAVPIKTVHFEYSYSLCKGVPNNINSGNGKLTLDKVYFTYQHSTRGAHSAYVFGYGNINSTVDNPDYDSRNIDRWGNLKMNSSSYGQDYPYVDFPYTNQFAGGYPGNSPYIPPYTPPEVAAWSLKEIELPSGGTIKINYESDDYGYVENQKAMRMFDIYRLGNQANTNFNNRNGATNKHDTEVSGANTIWFQLEDPTNPNVLSMTNTDFYKRYLNNGKVKKIYFKIYSKLLYHFSLGHDVYDYVTGYADVDPNNCGVGTGPDAGFGYVRLQSVTLDPISGQQVNPFTRAAIQHLRVNRPELIHDFHPANSSNVFNNIVNLIGSVWTLVSGLADFLVGPDLKAFTLGYGQEIQLNGRSVIRLCDPDGIKYGGGVRVKKLTITDNWVNTPPVGSPVDNPSTDLDESNPDAFVYGQEYDYKIDEDNNGLLMHISSGVAYEPKVGGEESALRNPVDYSESALLGSSSNLFVEKPVLDGYYPGPSVGYRKVTVKSIAPKVAQEENNLTTKSQAPITVYEFYSPKDFPVYATETDMNNDVPITRPLLIPGIYSSFKKRQAKSQGYYVELNDMAGKLHTVTEYTVPQHPNDEVKVLSRKEYVYHTMKNYDANILNRLSCKVQVLSSGTTYDASNNLLAGNYETALVGQTHDIFIDMNENLQESQTAGLDLNLDMQFFIPPLIWIMPLIQLGDCETSLRTAVTNKIVYKTGILKEVIATDGESTIKSETIAYDSESGEPLLTKVTNEFNDPIYNYTYPAYWYYPNMGGAYENFGLTVPLNSNSITNSIQGDITINSSYIGYFREGDEIYIDFANGSSHAGVFCTVTQILSAGYIRCVQRGYMADNNNPNAPNASAPCIPIPSGYSASNAASLKIIRSGNKNLFTFEAGKLVTRNSSIVPYNPLDNSNTFKTPTAYTFDNSNEIINASAVEYNDYWPYLCGSNCVPTPNLFYPTSAVTCSYNYPKIYSAINFLNGLVNTNNLAASNVLVYSPSTGYEKGFSEPLNFSPYQCDVNWNFSNATPSSTYSGYYDFAATLDCSNCPSGTTCPACTLTAVLPCPPSWINSFSFESIYCSTQDMFVTVGYTDPSAPGIPIVGSGKVVVFYNNTSWNVSTLPYTTTCISTTCNINNTFKVNPYSFGIKGLWRPELFYNYQTSRTQTNNIRTDGIYSDFSPFNWNYPSSTSPKWKLFNKVTKYSTYGFELENKDILGNYSGALYGYKNSLVTAIAKNAAYRELAFDAFEDYPLACDENHFRFVDGTVNVSNDYSHTGKNSIKVVWTNQPSQNPSTNYVLRIGDFENYCETHKSGSQIAANQALLKPYNPYKVEVWDCVSKFSPNTSEKYVISAWVKEVHNPEVALKTYQYPKIRIEFLNIISNPTVTMDFTASGEIIDGWQRVYAEFSTPDYLTNNISRIKVTLLNTAPSSATVVYFDDIRIHPANSNMVSYVYDPLTLKLVAELDENNYATIYIYDDEGNLTKVKKETIDGIKTIKEGRINSVARP